MVTQVTPFSTPLPDTFNQTAEEFEASVNTLVSELNPRFSQVNSAISEMNEFSLNAESAAGELANAAWVSGTTYTAGEVRYSPIDFFSYRRKTNGAGTTDPSLDATNWALQTRTSNGGSDTTSSATDVTLTSSSGRLQLISMTAPDKKTFLPSATTLEKGTSLFVIRNAGGYRFSLHKNGGAFVCYVNPGQVFALGCSDISTAAGVWTISGTGVQNIYSGNSSEVLNSVDSIYIAVAMLSATKAICAFKDNSSGFMYAVILNYGSSSSSPLQISDGAVRNITIAALSSTKAVAVYQANSGSSDIKGYVLDVSGNIITPGLVKTIATAVAGSFPNGASLTALSSSKLLLAYMNSESDTIKERVLDVTGTTIGENSQVTADTSSFSTSASSFLLARSIISTKALVAFLGSSMQINLRLQSVTGSIPAPSGSVLSLQPPGTDTIAAAFAVCIMSSSRAVVLRSVDRRYGGVIAYLIDISGSTPILVGSKDISLSYRTGYVHICATKLDSNRVYMSWPGGYSLGIDALVLTITGDDQIIAGSVTERSEPNVTFAAGYLACDALDASHVMQVCRNASTFLSAKTMEIS